MAFNKVSNFIQGYVQSVGNLGSTLAGVSGLALKGSTSLADACTDYSGNIYVTDPIKNIILKITDSGKIHVLAGLSGTAGNNGSATVSCSAARFNHPTGITCDKNGDLYICDTNNNQIRKISNNKVGLVAGAATPTSGTADGVGVSARFNKPHGIDIDNSGLLYIADTNNHAIRMIRGSVVSTLAGLKGTAGNYPMWANMTDEYGVPGANARFRYPIGITVNTNGYIFVSDTENHVIKRVDRDGRVRIFSGSGLYGATVGTAKNAKYQEPKFSDFDRSNGLYVVDFDEGGASRLVRVNEDGTSGDVINFTTELVGEGRYLAGIAVTPSSKLIVILSEYTNSEYSSSSSSSSL